MLCSSQGYGLLLHQRSLPTKHKEQQGTTASIYIYIFFLNQTNQASSFLPILPAQSWSLIHTDTLLVFSTCQLGTSIRLKSQLDSYTTAPLQFNNPGKLSFLSHLLFFAASAHHYRYYISQVFYLLDRNHRDRYSSANFSPLESTGKVPKCDRLKQTRATLKTLVSTNDNLFVFSSMNQNSNCHMA